MADASTYAYIVDRAPEPITLINRELVYEVVNDSYCRSLGRRKADLLGAHIDQVWGASRFGQVMKQQLQRCFDGEPVHFTGRFRFDGRERYVRVSYYPYAESGGAEPTHALLFSEDITREKRLERQLQHYQYRDPTTGLFNRRSLDLVLEQELARGRRSRTERSRAVLSIGLGDLAEISNKYGPHIGDVLLENSGLRIKRCLRTSDYVFRYDSRELIAVLTFVTHDTDVARVATKLAASVAVPYHHRGAELRVPCQVGVAMSPADGDTGEQLVAHASSAMNEARTRGHAFVLFNAALHRRAVERLRLETDMAAAFGDGEFELHYQPIVDPQRRTVGAEALIRWHHPSKGVLAPGQFIPIAEQSSIILAVGKWALYAVCRQARRWCEHYGLFLTVNVSAREFEGDELLATVEGAIRNADGLDPRWLRLELTETATMSDPERSIAHMHKLRDLGIEIFIDDFGVGQSSLSYLKQIPASTLKVDRTFIADIVSRPTEREYLQSIFAMARSRGLQVLVEGVDSAAQYQALTQMGCDLLQGFHISKPLAPRELEHFLLREREQRALGTAAG